ncbi:isoaspartyl peptidase/L-asparaginase [Shewanella sp. JM162201]|uniref:Isoaspartyl peptidase/L-asparaginase n=1 Tax=Shewanella jiangmenensis TaxID=2837387 RepID=A0ABS5V625_9GAMM|nr:isoaspartyl peptidase/L-asparaginase [Shewanella jiangmenensis]MBT1445890.1 isoaspartyl peptidase/L-asparaginase [Shewanella jiangmenensis]
MHKTLALATLLLSFGVTMPSHAKSDTPAADRPFGIAIHGGAGTISRAKLTEAQEKEYKATLEKAVNAGHSILASGGDSLDAIKAAINIMEDSPLFNAGVGAVYTFDGAHELDASVMDGKTMNAGAVAGVKHIKNPIDLALLVMNKSDHVMLAGAGAEEFALTQGMTLVPANTFDTEPRYQQLLDAKAKIKAAEAATKDFQASATSLDLDYKFGTVGAVALDKNGNLAAGTSTGGMTAKRFGRIGDSPVIGAGTYAENGVCAVSATGHGEYFIRYQVAGDICARIKYQQKTVQDAADEVVMKRLVGAGGSGGIIAIDGKGNIAMPFNTEGMYRASRVGNEAPVMMIWNDR